ncbi:MAG: MgtC/SapB family protein [Pseudomonadota bacterium]|nr:MgtC/SapB family protein [Pseudomonadota bacterium]
MEDEQRAFLRLSVALAIGLLIGVERGWKEREAREGERVAGVRTYGLIGLLGGGMALVAERLGPLPLALAFLALAGVLTAAYAINVERDDDAGITSLVAGLLTFAFGALAALGQVAVAAASAVVTTLLLSFKPVLHRWVSALERKELRRAGLKLLLISVVLLPILPDRGYGPWQALNPYQIWWMVVLIAGISFAGYFAIKLAGARKGVMMIAGLCAGVASSTALTLHFSRMARREPDATPVLATGILLACGTMYPRMLLIAGLINAQLLQRLWVAAAVMAALVYGTALCYWRSAAGKEETRAAAPLENPLELRVALGFGALLAVIMILGEALKAWLGEAGVLMLAGASGVAEVDAITLSLARMSRGDLAPGVAVLVTAAAANSLLKSAMAAGIGGRQLGLRVGVPLLAASAGGLLAVWCLTTSV